MGYFFSLAITSTDAQIDSTTIVVVVVVIKFYSIKVEGLVMCLRLH